MSRSSSRSTSLHAAVMICDVLVKESQNQSINTPLTQLCQSHMVTGSLTSSSAIAEKPRCRVGQFWPKVKDDILQTI